MMSVSVAKERLSRQELGWLLAQEARGAADTLREGVSQLTQRDAPVEIRTGPAEQVESTLDALDDAIGMLSLLEANPPARDRRGRIDVASLLCELAPNARIAIEPGGGTEVFGDEADLCRMLHVLVSQSSDPGAAIASTRSEIRVRREDDLVRISVELGPDRSATADVERRWLSRMAMRLGGRLELEGGTQSLLLPADGASDQREMDALRRELEQARKLGEAYARELASVFSAGMTAEPAPASERLAPATARFELLVSTAAALSRTLGHILDDLRADAALASDTLGDGSELASRLSKRVTACSELHQEISRLAQCLPAEGSTTADFVDTVRGAAQDSGRRAARHGVSIQLELPTSHTVESRPGTLELLVHAIAATPRGGQVVVRLLVDGRRATLTVQDGGPPIPDNRSEDLLKRRIDPTGLGRPAGIALLVADAAAEHLGHGLSIEQPAGGQVQLQLVLDG